MEDDYSAIPNLAREQYLKFREQFEIARNKRLAAIEFLQAFRKFLFEDSNAQIVGVVQRSLKDAKDCGNALAWMDEGERYLLHYRDWDGLCKDLKINPDISVTLMNCAAALADVENLGSVLEDLAKISDEEHAERAGLAADDGVEEAEMPKQRGEPSRNPKKPRKAKEQKCMDAAKACILEKFKDGKAQASTVMREGIAAGHKEGTLRKAKMALVADGKIKKGGRQVWTLNVKKS